MLITGYHNSDPKRSLKETKFLINKTDKQGFGSFITRVDLLRIEAEALVNLVNSKSLPLTPQLENEVFALFTESYENSLKGGLLTCATRV
jgi:hypothetical protein